MNPAAAAYGSLLAVLLVCGIALVVLLGLIGVTIAHSYLSVLAPFGQHLLYAAVGFWVVAVTLGAFKQRIWGFIASLICLELAIVGSAVLGFSFTEPRPLGDVWGSTLMIPMVTAFVFTAVSGHKIIEANVDHTYAD